MKTCGGFLGYVLACLIGVPTMACSDPSDHTRRWIGRDWKELVAVWGQPSEESRGDGAGRTMTYVSYWSDGFFATHVCRRAFTTDGAGIIRVLSSSDC